jgi:hypothetical protein
MKHRRTGILACLVLLAGCSESDEILNPAQPAPVGVRTNIGNFSSGQPLLCQFEGTVSGGNLEAPISFVSDAIDGSSWVPYNGGSSTVDTRYTWMLEKDVDYDLHIEFQKTAAVSYCWGRWRVMRDYDPTVPVDERGGDTLTDDRCDLYDADDGCTVDVTFRP